MKKIIGVFTFLLFYTAGALFAYVTTHVPVEAYWPERSDQAGYDEHTRGQWHYLQARERKGVSSFMVVCCSVQFVSKKITLPGTFGKIPSLSALSGA